MQSNRQLIARSLGGAAGIGSLATALIHQGFGGPEVEQTLEAARDQLPPLFLVQLEAVWIAATGAFVLIGIGMLMAALRRPGWLFSLGRAAAIWFGIVAAAFIWSGPRWGLEGVAAQVWLLVILAGLCVGASWLAAPRRP